MVHFCDSDSFQGIQVRFCRVFHKSDMGWNCKLLPKNSFHKISPLSTDNFKVGFHHSREITIPVYLKIFLCNL